MIDFGLIRQAIEVRPLQDPGLSYERLMVAHGDAANLCVDFDDDGCPTEQGIQRAEAFIDRARNWTLLAWWLYGVWASAEFLWRVVTCATTGHVLDDDSYGGPDSGWMGCHCTRCGWSHKHILY